MRISIHGFIGYAIMTTVDIGEALVLANRFIQLRMPFFAAFLFHLWRKSDFTITL